MLSGAQKLIIIGAGGAGLEALQVATRMATWSILGFADDAPHSTGDLVGQIPVVGTVAETLERFAGQSVHFHCAVGANTDRRRLAEFAESREFIPATLVDPGADVAASATIGAGCYVGPLAFVGPLAVVGRHVLINVGCSIGHHSNVGDFSQVCPGARVSGASVLGTGSFIGSNGVVAPGVRVGDWATVGAASLAAREVPPGCSAIGVPARIIALPSK
jgi:sugar O-acyltransferase (sialic acid O-acetyltransferase NeuD family)